MTAFSATLCCANVEGAPVTDANPATPGEIVYVYATGLGLPVLNDTISSLLATGAAWPQGGPVTSPSVAVSALAGGSTADVISATLQPGTVGTFKVVLHLNGSLSPNSSTPVTIAQDIYVSNIAYIPVSTQSATASSSTTTSAVPQVVKNSRQAPLMRARPSVVRSNGASGSTSTPAARPQARGGRVLEP
jgi:hypothetical protein